MPRRFRPPMLAVAAALLGLIALLATLQYRWLGQISAAERQRMTTTLSSRATVFAEDFDRELTLAFRLFQLESGSAEGAAAAGQLAARFDRWNAVARHPRLVSGAYVATRDGSRTAFQRFDLSARTLAAAEWPAAFAPIRERLEDVSTTRTAEGTLVVRTLANPVWPDVPALVVPAMPVLLLPGTRPGPPRIDPLSTFVILQLDRDYITREMLPALAAQHFRGLDGFDYEMAVVRADGAGLVYGSSPTFHPTADATADASADLFRVRPQEFAEIASDVRRFTALLSRGSPAAADDNRKDAKEEPESNRMLIRTERAAAIVLEHAATSRDQTIVAGATISDRSPAPWRLLVKHPYGSLEAAVDRARRRNLLISSSILAVLAASLVMIVVSTRRSQELARQQMEFVAAVSHELRTPLAVIRSAGDNLADGVVHDQEGIRRYGALVRSEGRRLSEMVEQILEFSGIQSGQRTFTPAPVAADALVESVLKANDALITAEHLDVSVDVPSDLPPIAGDEAALRRVLQNLVGNAIKYGRSGGWVGISAAREGSTIRLSVRDRGIGIAPADQAHIFDPFYRAADVVAAQIQGAGLGLSLVQRIVQAHGGRVTARSTKGEGSEFIVHLPAAGEAAVRQARAVHQPADASDAT